MVLALLNLSYNCPDGLGVHVTTSSMVDKDLILKSDK